jgi:hypothetical protein
LAEEDDEEHNDKALIPITTNDDDDEEMADLLALADTPSSQELSLLSISSSSSSSSSLPTVNHLAPKLHPVQSPAQFKTPASKQRMFSPPLLSEQKQPNSTPSSVLVRPKPLISNATPKSSRTITNTTTTPKATSNAQNSEPSVTSLYPPSTVSYISLDSINIESVDTNIRNAKHEVYIPRTTF